MLPRCLADLYIHFNTLERGLSYSLQAARVEWSIEIENNIRSNAMNDLWTAARDMH